MKIRCQIPLAKSTIVSVGLLRWMTPMGSSTHPLASAMHRPATRGSPRQPRPGPPGAQTRRRATQGAAGCHRQRHGEGFLRGGFFSSKVTICDASNTVILDLHIIFTISRQVVFLGRAPITLERDDTNSLDGAKYQPFKFFSIHERPQFLCDPFSWFSSLWGDRDVW